MLKKKKKGSDWEGLKGIRSLTSKKRQSGDVLGRLSRQREAGVKEIQLRLTGNRAQEGWTRRLGIGEAGRQSPSGLYHGGTSAQGISKR